MLVVERMIRKRESQVTQLQRRVAVGDGTEGTVMDATQTRRAFVMRASKAFAGRSRMPLDVLQA